ncbi:SprT-like,Zinc finger, Rad18-type putative [Cinara cedri]|uniref:Protein with SprT-like domain at the N terminus n=1 Tax=Cinara cedri TaxID=506608 RepID=A0A5E4MEW8_9HEMI|nr:SprT-like,Zinc finger, Rad18-type putative [Cinara cedri]
MDTSNDYLLALQLQNELIDLTDIESTRGSASYNDSIASTSSSSFTAIIDLTKSEKTIGKKKKTVNIYTSPPKRLRYQAAVAKDSIVNHSWETLDPNPDIHGLFLAFNRQYFWGTLETVMIQWSKRMTVCAGLCRFQHGFCSISLSEPLLKLRPRKDLVETLLHEMIHAYLFLTNSREHRDRDGHGAEFCKHMYRINIQAGTNISIYHNFHEEVKSYKQHWWRCNGPCKSIRPFYGYVKRSMNRAPGPNDRWWVNHQTTCSGHFIKVKEPEDYGAKKKTAIKQPIPKQSVKSANKITNFVKILDTKKVTEENSKIKKSTDNDQQKTQDDPYIGNDDDITLCPVCSDPVFRDFLNSHLKNCSQLKQMFGDEIDEMKGKCKCLVCNETVDRSLMDTHLDGCKMLINVFENDFESLSDENNCINCPNCDKLVKESIINEHLDICISS